MERSAHCSFLVFEVGSVTEGNSGFWDDWLCVIITAKMRKKKVNG